MGLLSSQLACWGLLGNLPKCRQRSTTTTKSQHLLSKHLCLPLMESNCFHPQGWTALSSLLLKTPPGPGGSHRALWRAPRHHLAAPCRTAGSPSLPEQRQRLGSHVSAQITASTRKLTTSKIIISPAVPLGVFQHRVAQPFSVPRLSNTIQHFQNFGSFQPISLFILVSNCCSMLLRAKLSHSWEPPTCSASAACSLWRVSGCRGH